MTKVSVGKADLKPGKSKLVSVKDKKLALFNIDGKYHCTDGLCTHVGGPLWEGPVSGKTVTCPWHGSQFDVITGKVLAGPAKKSVKTYKAIEKNKELFVEI